MKKTLWLIALAALALLGFGYSVLHSDQELLVRIEYQGVEDLQILNQFPLSVHYRGDNELIATAALAVVDDLKEKGFAVEVIDETPWTKPYYLVTRPRGLPLGVIPPLGQLIYRKDGEAILELADEDRLPLQKAGFVLAKISRDPLPLLVREKRSLRELPFAPQPNPVIRALVARVSNSSIAASLLRLQNFKTRFAFSDSIRSASQWLHDKFVSFGYTDVAFDTFFVQGTIQRNVVVTKRGVVEPDRVIIVGGHYDSIVLDGNDPMVIAPGVDDNGSGTAAVLEMARVLADVDLDATVKFIPFAAEELGLLGSQHYARRAFQQGMNIDFMINLDMIANIADNFGNIDSTQVNLLTNEASRGFAELMVEMAQQYTTLTPRLGPSSANSDHFPFQQAGYPAVFVHEWVFSPNWHRVTDVFDNVNVSYANQVIRLALSSLLQVAGSPDVLTGSYVTYSRFIIDDDKQGESYGNGNGFLDTGEKIEMPVLVKNIGDTLARNVTATLWSEDPFVTITDAVESFGDIAPGDSAYSLDDFDFTLASEIPEGHAILFSLRVQDAEDHIWDSDLVLRVLRPAIDFASFSIVEVQGDGDQIPDPGELCHLIVELENWGKREGRGITGRLSTTDGDILMLDDEASFTDIPVGVSGNNARDPFLFYVRESALPHVVSFHLRVNEGEGFYIRDLAFNVLLEKGPVLLVIDDGRADNSAFYGRVFEDLGIPARKWKVQAQGTVPLDTLMNYPEVVWFTGGETVNTLTTEDQNNLEMYLKAGGKLLLSGQLIGFGIGRTPFYANYLHAKFISFQVGLHTLKRVEGNPVTDVPQISLATSGPNQQPFASEIDPLPPALPIFKYDPTTPEGPGRIRSSGTGALAVDTDTFKVAYFAFGLEGILSDGDRRAVIEDVFSWFKGSPIDIRSTLSVASVVFDDDSLGTSRGDGDGIINPGESVEVTVIVTNTGLRTARDVVGTLRSLDPFVTITDSIEAFGDIGPQRTVSSEGSFDFRVWESAPHGHLASFELVTIDSVGNRWSHQFSAFIYLSSTVSGRVTDVGTGLGIPRAEVLWAGPIEAPGQAVQTDSVFGDESGNYSLALPNGRYELQALASGYLPSPVVLVNLPPDTTVNFVLTSPAIAVAPDSIVVQLNAGETYQDTLAIRNVRTGSLAYSIFEMPSQFVVGASAPLTQASFVHELHSRMGSLLEFNSRRLAREYNSWANEISWRPLPSVSGGSMVAPPDPSRWKHLHLDPDEPGNTLDLKGFYAQNDETNLFFKVTLHQAVASPPEELIWVLFLDTDVNPSTGAAINNIGADFVIALGALGNIILTSNFDPIPGNPFPHHVLLSSNSDSLEVGIQLGQIGKPTRIDVVNVLLNRFQQSEDVAPDDGLLHIPYSTYDAPWLSETPLFGKVEGGKTDWVVVSLNATGLPGGSYRANIVIENNQPEGEAVVMPVRLNIAPTAVEGVTVTPPLTYGLSQNFPNPFNSETVIKYQLPVPGKVTIKIYNVLGMEVRTLVNEEKGVGYFTTRWDGKDDAGRAVASGVYLYRIHAKDFEMTKKMLLLE